MLQSIFLHNNLFIYYIAPLISNWTWLLFYPSFKKCLESVLLILLGIAIMYSQQIQLSISLNFPSLSSHFSISLFLLLLSLSLPPFLYLSLLPFPFLSLSHVWGLWRVTHGLRMSNQVLKDDQSKSISFGWMVAKVESEKVVGSNWFEKVKSKPWKPRHNSMPLTSL